jgi:UDP-N-acetyl-D-mannosaminuronic acid dehydrogenase
MFERGIAVIGLGYIGLPTGAALADRGVRIKGVDVNQRIVDAVSAGRAPVVEPDLQEAITQAHDSGLLTASTTVPEADAYLIAVPTPFNDDYSADLSFVRSAAESIAPHLRGGEVVILESTSPPGTTRKISEWIGALRPDLKMPHDHAADPDVFVAHCPERVLPGRIMTELVENNRIVGGLSSECAARAAEVYRIFCRGEIALTDAESAEMSKLAENTFRDVNIALANELATICEGMGLDVWEVIRLANKHPRVNILRPGPGVGGHCIAVDPWFIVAADPINSRLIRAAREINDARPGAVIDQVAAVTPAGGTVAALGLAFKANVDDLRGSPAITVAKGLAERLSAAKILAVEPYVDTLPASLASLPNVVLTAAAEAVAAADTVVLLVDHEKFRDISAADLSGKAVVDTRGFFPTEAGPLGKSLA